MALSEEEVNEEYAKMSGQQKAAAFLMSISQENSSRLFSMMEVDEIKDLSGTMSSLGKIDSSVLEKLFQEYAENVFGGSNVVGNLEATEKLLIKALGKEKVEMIMDDIRGPAGRTTWDKLGNVNEEILANYLKNEYPQTIALVLSKLQPGHAARVLSVLPEELSMEVIMRMLSMETVKKEVLDGIEKTLRQEFMSNLARTQKRDSFEEMAEIFNNFDRATETKFLETLESKDSESAERIRSLMFTFDDLAKIDAAGIQVLLRAIDKDSLPLALKGATEEVKTLFFSNMGERQVKILNEEMETMGPVRLREVDEAQMAIIMKAKDLAAKGEITIADASGEDQLVY